MFKTKSIPINKVEDQEPKNSTSRCCLLDARKVKRIWSYWTETEAKRNHWSAI